MNLTLKDSNILIKNLQNPALYPHAVKYFKVIETHISYILLTGQFAYKIKKPIKFSFIDYSTLKKRKEYYYQEFELNQRLAPELYLQVIPITGSIENPTFNCQNSPEIEFMIQMKEFKQTDLLPNRLLNQKLSEQHIYQLSQMIAQYHQEAPTTVKPSLGNPKTIHKYTMDNFKEIFQLSPWIESIRIQSVNDWCQSEMIQLNPIFLKRKENQKIKKCHGDLHLSNMALYQNHICIFDCLEFNEEIRWIDPISEIAFLIMDLIYYHKKEWAFLFLNQYLELTCDYTGLPLLTYYLVYRALVRSKVNFISYQNIQNPVYLESAIQYFKLCEFFIQKNTKPCILMMHGLSGSGKSFVSQKISHILPGIRIRTDIIRQNILSSIPKNQWYQDHHIDAVYQHMLSILKTLIGQPYTIILDGTFLSRRHRNQFYALSQKLNISWGIISMEVDLDQIQSKILNAHPDKASDATFKIVKEQHQYQDVLTKNELKRTISIHHQYHDIRLNDVVSQIHQMLNHK